MGPHYARSQSASGLVTPQPPRLWASSEPARRLGAGGAPVLLTWCGARYVYPYKKFEKLAGKANPPLRRGRTVRRDYLARIALEPLVAFGV